MLSIKDGVLLRGLQSEILIAVLIADQVYADVGANLVITSALDGEHKPDSLHYKGIAIDFRIRDLHQDQIEKIFERLKCRLNDEYDVVLESDHIHIEFDHK